MSSKLGMCACREYRHWSPVGVVSGIGDELIIERQRAPFVDVIGIISLKNFLFAVVQLAITVMVGGRGLFLFPLSIG